MFHLWKKAGFIVMAAFLVWSAGIVRDRLDLGNHLIRLHVVANSDSEEDQAVKLQVRDAVTAYLQAGLSGCTDMAGAKEYLKAELPEIRKIADQALADAGESVNSQISLCRERFDVRHYDSFSLPAGVYESLRITIGEGKGKNWWCVVFPSLCYSAAGQEFADIAVGAGFSEELVSSMEGKNPVEIRFFLLDLLGKLENMLFDGGI